MVTSHIAVSLDGYAAGPDQSLQDPLGRGGMRLHEWLFAADRWREQHGETGGESGVDSRVVDELTRDVGAYVMGRGMFGGGTGPWDEGWRGWWGEDPPFHTPVFVLTHHPRPSLAMAGGTDFHFVTEGIHSALEQARAAAGGREVSIGGGAATVRQYLDAGLIDQLQLHIVPIVLGAGEPLFAGLTALRLHQTRVLAGPTVTHVTYRVLH